MIMKVLSYVLVAVISASLGAFIMSLFMVNRR